MRWLLVNSFDWCKTTRHSGGPMFYDFLFLNGIIKKDPEQIRENFYRAIEMNMSILQLLGIKPEDYKSVGSVINDTKALCVDDFFLELKIEGKHIKELIPGNRMMIQ